MPGSAPSEADRLPDPHARRHAAALDRLAVLRISRGRPVPDVRPGAVAGDVLVQDRSGTGRVPAALPALRPEVGCGAGRGGLEARLPSQAARRFYARAARTAPHRPD